MPANTGRPRLRELRTELGWTQQQLADKLNYFAWTHGQGHTAVNADMVAKWERGVKGISPRYKALLCQLFGVTAEQLGFAPAPSTAPSRPVRDAESLVSMLDGAASLLDQLGAAGTALAPQMLSAWKDTMTNRRTMLALLDPAATDPAGHARAATATVTDLEQLAERYQALHATADPAALLTPVVAHVRMATATLGREHTAAQRRRLLRNLATVATLAGRLAYEDLGDAASGRAYYSVALDNAREASDHQAAGPGRCAGGQASGGVLRSMSDRADRSVACAGVLVAGAGGIELPCRFVERSAGADACFPHLIAGEPVEAG
jgi:transcriptional regulator with XRE-family HTH domain